MVSVSIRTRNCVLYNYCHTNPCNDQGVCVNNMTGYVCFCNQGFMGKSCSIIDHCAANPLKKIPDPVLQNQMDIFAIAMQATMGKIVNSTWMNVLSVYAQQDGYAMIVLVDLHVFGKITVAKEAY